MMYDREYKELEDKYNALQKENKELKKQLQNSITWSVEDFLGYDTNGKYTITPEQAQEALNHMIRKHDASMGITWDTIEYYLQEYGTLNFDDNEEIN